MDRYSLGFDLGSISLNTIALGSSGQILEEHYTLRQGRPFSTLYEVLVDLLGRLDPRTLDRVAVTGTGGQLAAELVGAEYVNEIVAQTASVARYYPETRTVIEPRHE